MITEENHKIILKDLAEYVADLVNGTIHESQSGTLYPYISTIDVDFTLNADSNSIRVYNVSENKIANIPIISRIKVGYDYNIKCINVSLLLKDGGYAMIEFSDSYIRISSKYNAQENLICDAFWLKFFHMISIYTTHYIYQKCKYDSRSILYDKTLSLINFIKKIYRFKLVDYCNYYNADDVIVIFLSNKMSIRLLLKNHLLNFYDETNEETRYYFYFDKKCVVVDGRDDMPVVLKNLLDVAEIKIIDVTAEKKRIKHNGH